MCVSLVENLTHARGSINDPARLAGIDAIGHYVWELYEVFDDKGVFVGRRAWLDNRGHPHTEALRTTERFRRTSVGSLELGAIVDEQTRSNGNRENGRPLQAVNAWRTSRGLAAVPESQIDANDYHSVDLRVTKSISLGGTQKIEVIGQVFNVFGRDNLQAAWVTNALSNQFGEIRQAFNRQQGEVAIRFAW